MLSEKAIAARREYKKQWAHKNPEKVKAQQERYWQKRAERKAQEIHEAHQAHDAQQEEGKTDDI